MKKKIRKVALWVLFLFCLAIFIYCVFFYNYIPKKRQKLEEDLAVSAIDYWLNMESSKAQDFENDESVETSTELVSVSQTNEYNETEIEAEVTEKETVSESVDDDGIVHIDVISEFDIEDNKYFQKNGVTFTPDYGSGVLFCALHYEKCGILREVFIGSEDDIVSNLDKWIPCVANPWMDFGVTDIVIKAHNHQEQDLSMNALKNAEIGDMFNLISDSGVYIYEVTDIYAMPRGLVEQSFDNDLLSYSADTCFLVTCGRDNFLVKHFKYMPGANDDYSNYVSVSDIAEYYTDYKSSRYQDYIVEGNLITIIPLSESEYATTKWKELQKKTQKEK